MSQVILAEYGRAKTINFDLYEVDGVDFRTDAADAGADCSIMKDEGAEGTCDNDFVDEGQSYSLVLTATELQAARATILIVDSATKVWLDKHIYIETYGHPSSAHPFMSPYWANGAVNDASASTTAWTFDGFTEATADHVIGSELTFTSGANAGQCRTVTDYTSTVITVSPALLAAPADNDEFVLKAAPQTALGFAPGPDIAILKTAIGTDGTNLTEAGGDGDQLTAINLPNQTMDITGDITGNLSGSVGSVTGHTNQTADHTAGIAANQTDLNTIIADTSVMQPILDTIYNAFVLTSATIETVTSQTQLVIPATADATDDQAYHGALAVIIDGTDPNQKSFRVIETYTASSRTVVLSKAPDFTVTTADTITILATTDAGGVWDMLLTGNKHNIATSSGKRLRQLEEAFIMAEGVIATVTDNHTFTLDSGAVATTDYYIGGRLQIEEGTGAGQSRIITAYTSGRVVTTDSNFTTAPDTSSRYSIVAADVHVAVSDADLAEGFVATYTNTTTITLDAGAVATTDYYKGELIIFTSGDGKGQAREITGYTSGRVVTMSPPLITALSATADATLTGWHIQAAVDIGEVADEVWDEALSGHTTAGSFGKAVADTEVDADGIVTSLGVFSSIDYGSGTDLSSRLFDTAGATFSTTTDSQEALRDRGDSAWITATGFSTHNAAAVWSSGTRTLTATGLDLILKTSTFALAMADAILARNVSNVEASAGEHTICTLVLSALESSITTTTWTIKRTDGTTTHATKTVTVDATASPITGVS